MPTDWSILFLQVRDALGLTQKQLGALLGMDRRTIQRWEDRGGIGMDRKQAEILAAALRPSHPELADTVLETVRLKQVRHGRLASPEVVASILEAAAHDVGGGREADRQGGARGDGCGRDAPLGSCRELACHLDRGVIKRR